MDSHTQSLIARASEGDSDALARLIERYQGRLLELVRGRLGRGLRSRLESGDVVQDVMVEAIRCLDRFEAYDERAFLRWLAGIVENRLRNEARTARRRPQVGDQAFQLDAFPGRSGISQVELSEERTYQLSLVEAGIQRLRGDKQSVLLLRREGRSYAEIGRRLGRSEDAVRMLHRRALAELVDEVHRLRSSEGRP